MLSLDQYDEVWCDYMAAAHQVQDDIEGRPLTQYILDSIRERMYALYLEYQKREPLLPYIDAWIQPRDATYCLIVRPK